MKSEPNSPIRSIGGEIAYCDTAEERILEILTRVTDTSDGSDELAAEIVDWPTRYHCSPQRSNILRPFKIISGMRVLEIGAGTGALTRYLAEQGAHVTAIEGTRERAESVVERCRDLTTVEVLCGDFNRFEPTCTYDIVVVVGVLEYAASGAGGRSTSSSFLDRVTRCLAPSGVLILAIENQLGLKYLLGGKEDHLGTAWVGIEDYPGDHGVRTWGRQTLGRMLGTCGLTTQRWFFPFPDYKTPSSIVAEATYDLPQAPTLVDQWTSPPIIDYAHPERPLHDDRAVHKVFLSEGLGAEVSNSFLVAATRQHIELDTFIDPSILIHRFGGDRQKARRRVTVVKKTEGTSLWVRSQKVFPDTAARADSWIDFHPNRDQAYSEGRNLEQEIIDACRQGSSTEVERILDDWWNHLAALETAIKTSPADCHPFLAGSTAAALGPDFLDVQPSNFIRAGEDLLFIDREWVAEPAVDARLVQLRALWYLAHTLVISGTPMLWPQDTTVQNLAGRWMGRWVPAPKERDFLAFYQAEAALQVEVSGGDLASIQAALQGHGQLSRTTVLAGGAPGHGASQVESGQALISDMKAAMEKARLYQVSLENQIKAQHDHADEVARYQSTLSEEIKDQRNRAEVAEGHYQSARNTIEKLELEAGKAGDHIAQLENKLREASDHIEKIEAALDMYRNHVENLETSSRVQKATITDLGNHLETAEITLGQVRARLAEAEAWRRGFERRPLVRIYRRLRWWLPQ